MKIIPKDKTERFANIPQGDCFSKEIDGKEVFFMKTTTHCRNSSDMVNSVSLANGQLLSFMDGDRVVHLDSAYLHTYK